jgi:hypothetical protein
VTVSRDDPNPARLRGLGQQYPVWLKPDLELPGNLDPRVAALAKRIAGDKDPVEAAAALEKWLSTNLQYTRDLAGEVADPISNFLFKRRKGHCELFSSTMVIMLRTLGIPARNVTGYFGGERTNAGYYAVRGGDAHSWVEVYFPGAGFMVFEPDAGRRARWAAKRNLGTGRARLGRPATALAGVRGRFRSDLAGTGVAASRRDVRRSVAAALRESRSGDAAARRSHRAWRAARRGPASLLGEAPSISSPERRRGKSRSRWERPRPSSWPRPIPRRAGAARRFPPPRRAACSRN